MQEIHDFLNSARLLRFCLDWFTPSEESTWTRAANRRIDFWLKTHPLHIIISEENEL